MRVFEHPRSSQHVNTTYKYNDEGIRADKIYK